MPEPQDGSPKDGTPADGSPSAGDKSWLDSYKFEGNDRTALEKYASPEEALRGGIEAQRAIGKKVSEHLREAPSLIKDSGLDASQVLRQIGAPESPEAYAALGITPPADLHDDLKAQLSEDRVTEFQTLASEIGLLPSQYKTIMEWNYKTLQADNGKYVELLNEKAAAADAGKKALVERWGSEEQYAKNMELVRRAAEKYGDESLVEAAKNTGNPALINALHALAEAKVAEGEIVIGDPKKTGNETPETVFTYPEMS